MTKPEVLRRIEEIGIVPALRVSSYDDARFAVNAIVEAGISIVEVTMTTPAAIELISELVRGHPGLLVGVGTVFDGKTARQCLDGGAQFLTSPGLDLDIVELAVREDVLIFPGVLTPSEVQAARKAGCDIVKVFPCAQVGGPGYIRALKAPFPGMRMIASGGVTQTNAAEFIQAGAAALGIGGDLMPRKAIRMREAHWIQELGRRFSSIVHAARSHAAHEEALQ